MIGPTLATTMLAVVRPIIATVGAAQLARLVVPGRFRYLYLAAGRQYDVDPDLLHATAVHESGDDPTLRGLQENPNAIGRPNTNGTRDYGLMQINESNFATLGLDATSAMDPVRSVDAAARLLSGTKRLNPGRTGLDERSVYNAGWRTKLVNGARVLDRDAQGRPQVRIGADGAYLNLAYVMSVGSWWLLIKTAGLAPIKTLNWTPEAVA